MKSILQTAEDLVYGEKQKTYGHPYYDFERVARMWTAFLGSRLPAGSNINPWDVPIMMILLKISREACQHNTDNLIDIAGYADCCQRVYDEIDNYVEPEIFDPEEINKELQQAAQEWDTREEEEEKSPYYTLNPMIN